MGNKMFKPAVRSTVVRPLINYNVEDRAMKVISKEKPTPAPSYPAMQEIMDKIRKDPELMTKNQTDPKLAEHLQQVFITSEGTNPTIKRKENLPQDRTNFEGFEFGYEEPSVIPQGKVTLRLALEFLSKNQNEPQIYTAEKIAEEYILELEVVKDIMEHFKPFQLFSPKQKPQQSVFMKAIKA